MKLLLAEDEKELSNALCVLFKHNNYDIDAVYNGEDALYYAKNAPYDAIILDIMMPKMNGITVLKTLRSLKITTPILLLTAKGQLDDKVLGLEAGADDYLAKPFFMKELLARIKALTRRYENNYENEINIGNIVVDTLKYEIKCNDNTISLTNKEFQILEYLIKSKNHILSMDDFLNKIWGFDSDVDYNVFYVNISSLRKKLNTINANVNIKAIRNVGYTLEIKDDKAN